MRLIDDDDVPIGVLQIGAVLRVLFEGINRDDGFIVLIKRVVGGWNARAQPLDTDRIQPCERNGETTPQFLLKLRQHTFHGRN